MKHGGISFALATAIGLVAPLMVSATRSNLDGPPPGHTGGFGEPTCRACHAGKVDPTVRVLIADLPEHWSPGETYRFDVVVRGRDLLRGGFQLTARWADGEAAGRQAGLLTVADDRGAVTDSAGISYAHHIADGTTPMSPGSVRWTVAWTAPDTTMDGAIVFHVAGNAANDDNSELGDLIATESDTAFAK